MSAGAAPMGVAVAVVAVLAWGVLAFGGVYAWAAWPLVAACAAIGVAGVLAGRRAAPPVHRPLFIAIGCLVGASLVQLVPLPQAVLAWVSPATDRLLLDYSLPYASAASASMHGAGGAAVGPPWHALSIDPERTWRGVAFLSAFGVFLVGVTRWFERVGARRTVVGMVGLAVLVALIGIVQRSTLPAGAYHGMRIYGVWEPESLLTTPFGPFVNRNHFAGWMIMALPLTLGFLFQRLERGHGARGSSAREWIVWLSTPDGGLTMLAAFGAVVMGMSLLLAGSRAGLAACGAAVLLLCARTQRMVGGARGRAVVIGILVTGASISLAWAGSEMAVRRVAETPESVQLRLDAWAEGVRIVRDFPLAGTGLNTYATATVVYGAPERARHFREAHNDYLQLASEGGLLLSVPALVVVALLVRGVRAGFRDDRARHVPSWGRAGATAGLAAIALQSLVDFSLQMPGNAALFVVLAALAIRRAPAARRGVLARPDEGVA